MSTAVDALGASTPATTTNGTGFSSLSAGDFTKIILTELGKQDPLQPNDTNALLQQISTVRSIQSNMDLSGKLTSLVSQNEFASAANMIGKLVSGVDEQNQRVAGKVIGLSKTSDGTYLALAGGQRMKLSNLDQIVDPSALGGGPTSPTTPANPSTPTSPTSPASPGTRTNGQSPTGGR